MQATPPSPQPADSEEPSRVEAWAELGEKVRAASTGDRAQEAELCLRFAPAIRTFARRRLRSAEAVEEFAQDVLLLVVQALRAGAIAEPARFGGFVLGVCRNVARERARTRDRRDTLWEAYANGLACMEAEQPAQNADEVALLEDCLSQLSSRARMVVRHAYVDEESSQEIAVRLGVQEGNVRVIRHRALGALRECLGTKMGAA
ncbi:MAG TPA: sigma-70 family RNA polymerase sigma factor [Polyangiaceae bacterium]|nr:sigma-70 family RNA polymerase sigma factor [Polyangiaceae bacterium]